MELLINCCHIHWYDAVCFNAMYAVTLLNNCCRVSVKLKLLVRDTKLEGQTAANEASNLAKRGCVGFIGPWASGPTIRVSNLLSIPSIDRALIGFSATSPQLSEDEFSNFLRTKESDAVSSKLMAKLMKGPLFG